MTGAEKKSASIRLAREDARSRKERDVGEILPGFNPVDEQASVDPNDATLDSNVTR